MKHGIADVRPLHGCESMDSCLVNPDTAFQAFILNEKVFMRAFVLLGSLWLCGKCYIQPYRNFADCFWLRIFKSSFFFFFLFHKKIDLGYRLGKTAHSLVVQRKGGITFPLFLLIPQKIVDTALWNLWSSHLFSNI